MTLVDQISTPEEADYLINRIRERKELLLAESLEKKSRPGLIVGNLVDIVRLE